MVQVIADPTIQKRLEELGMAYRKMSVAEFNAFVAAQVKDWEPAVKASGAKLN
jgi:tripartite-type tricarboxylate transporter receptor subunit TctC